MASERRTGLMGRARDAAMRFFDNSADPARLAETELIATLNEVASAVSSAMSVEEVLDAIVERAKRVTDTDKAVLVLADHHSERLDFDTMVVRGSREPAFSGLVGVAPRGARRTRLRVGTPCDRAAPRPRRAVARLPGARPRPSGRPAVCDQLGGSPVLARADRLPLRALGVRRFSHRERAARRAEPLRLAGERARPHRA